jgi:hypothetical protein
VFVLLSEKRPCANSTFPKSPDTKWTLNAIQNQEDGMRKPSHAFYAEADLDRKPLYDSAMIREMRKKEVMNSKSTRCLYEPGWSASGVDCLESKNHKSTVGCCVILESLPISKFQNRNLPKNYLLGVTCGLALLFQKVNLHHSTVLVSSRQVKKMRMIEILALLRYGAHFDL